MKTLSAHTLIYDDECPLCNQYTKAFVKTGMLDANGREAYTAATLCTMPSVDWNRARNEIAMINRTDNAVLYGVDSLIAIIGYNLPVLKRILNVRPVYYFLQKLYFIISYNRKAIVPGKIFEGNNACVPDLNYSYRWAYILLAWLVTSAVLHSYSGLLMPLVPETRFAREFIICGGQLVVQACVVTLVRRDRMIHYLGNMMTVSLAGALLLTPAFLLTSLIHSSIFYALYFMVVVGLMFLEHVRRVKILGLPWHITAIWVLHRAGVLFIILYL